MSAKNKTSYLNSNLRFLVSCCKTDPSKDDIAFIYSILNAEQLNINALINLARQHGILPFIYLTLKNLNIDHEILCAFKQQYLAIAQRNMLMTSELIKIMNLLEENNIQVLVFKGPALSQTAYGDITLRQYVDLDILVEESHLYKASKLIASNGYTPDKDIDFIRNDKLLDVSSDLGFQNIRNNIYIELHWKLFRKKLSVLLDDINIWSNTTIIKIHKKELRTLQSNLLLVYLCAHGSKHMWERIEWITDINLLIRHMKPIDWETVWEYAQKMHSTNTLILGLSLSQELFGTDLPSFIKEKSSSHKNIKSLKTYTFELLNNNTSTLTQDFRITAMFKKFNYHAKLYDSLWDKINFYFTIFFKVTQEDVFYINLPKQLYFLYYIIRPFRLIYTRLIKSDK